jgi:hypothetical protein
MTVTEIRPGAATGRVSPPVPRHRRRPVLDLCLASISGLVVAVLVGWGIDRYPTIGGDEGIYTEQAWAILHGRITPYVYTYDHPFFGWLQISVPSLIAQRLHIGGSLSVVNDRAVMVLYAVATVMAVFGIARRLGFRRPTALAAVAVMGLSPLYIVEARQVLLDNIATPWMLLALFLVLSPRQWQWTYAVAGAAFGVSVLSKETIVLFLPAIAYALWTHCYPPLRSMAVTVFAGMFVLTASIHLLFALLRHELFPGANHVSIWTNEIMYQLLDRTGSGAVWQSGSGRASLLGSWTSYDPWLLYAGGVAAVLCLAIRPLRVLGIAFVAWSLPILKPGGYLPSMYVIAGLPFAGLALAGLADTAYTWLRDQWLRRLGERSVRLRRLTDRGFRRELATLAVVGISLPLAIPMAVSYVRHEQVVQQTDDVAADAGALSYVEAHVSRRARVLTDDAFWVDLSRAGFSSDGWDGPISYYKFNLDPTSSKKNLPQQWKDLNYILSTAEMRHFLVGASPAESAIEHARIIRTFGSGPNRIELYQVDRTPYNLHGYVPLPPASRR